MKQALKHLKIGTQHYEGAADHYARFILGAQLKDRALWQKFVKVYSTREDAADDGWRGEYFGKMMRGACITYAYLPDEELYAVLEETVRALLSAQDEKGRIATYPIEHEFCGWDLWCRKYVLVGCLYFYDICKDAALREDILSAMKKHADYILDRIGEGKISVLDTSVWWGGLNSSSILEPIVELYKKTAEPRYLAFAEYILREGGCKDGNLLDIVKEGALLPHEYPTTKAYEMMSYFEGILAYYEVTGKEEYLRLTETFAEAVRENEITVIGCAGCNSEQFNHSVEKEMEPVSDKTIMQETCVTVTWMRLQERLLLDTGNVGYAERMEASALNALYGAVNLYKNPQFCKEEKALLPGVPFDSYSPLVAQPRGVGIGGYKKFADGGYYGCCACIGAAGTGLYPLSSVLKGEDGYLFLFYETGKIELDGVSAEAIYDSLEGKYTLTIHTDGASCPILTFRIPSWANAPTLSINGKDAPVDPTAKSYTAKELRDGDVLSFDFAPSLRALERNGKVAFFYGPYVLARDEGKEKGKITSKISLSALSYKTEDPEEGETIRLLLHSEKGEILLTDYASCGKHWDRPRSRVSVWHTVR